MCASKLRAQTHGVSQEQPYHESQNQALTTAPKMRSKRIN